MSLEIFPFQLEIELFAWSRHLQTGLVVVLLLGHPVHLGASVLRLAQMAKVGTGCLSG